MKKRAKKAKSKKQPELPAEKVERPDLSAAQNDYGGLNLSNFKKNLGCG